MHPLFTRVITRRIPRTRYTILGTILLTISLVAPSLLHAQQSVWEQVNGPFGGKPVCMETDPVSGTIYAGMDGAGVFRSTDDGRTWQAKNEGLPGFYVEALEITPSGDLYVIIHELGVYRSIDRGESWRKADAGLPVKGGLYHIFNDLASAPDGTIYTLNDSLVFLSRDNGASWNRLGTALPNASSHRYRKIVVTKSGRPVAGAQDGYVAWLNDSGAWKRVVSISGDIYSMRVAPDGSIWASGSNALYRSIDSGETWKRSDSGMTRRFTIRNVGFLPDGGMVAAADSAAFISSDGGRFWRPLLPDTFPTVNMQPFTITPAGTIIAAMGTWKNSNELSWHSDLYRSSDRGASWARSSQGLIGTAVYDILTAPNGDLYAAAGKLFRSSDGGATWTKLPVNAGRGNAIAPNGHIFVGLKGSPGGMHRSTDNGATWQRFPFSAAWAGMRVVIAPDGSLIAQLGNRTLQRSTDDGETWQYIPTKSQPNRVGPPEFANIVTLSPTEMIGAGGESVFRFRLDSGIWRAEYMSSKEFLVIEGATIGPKGELFIADYRGLEKTTDYGITWRSAGGGPNPVTVMTMPDGSMYSGNHGMGGVARLEERTGSVFWSSDSGTTWKNLPFKTQGVNIESFGADSNGRVYVGTSSRGMFRRSLPASVERAPQPQNETMMVRARPNPARGVATISFLLPERADVTLEIFNTIGAHVATLRNGTMEPGEHEAAWDASAVPSGVYHYRLRAGKWIGTGEVVVRD